jgi:FtsH-binding integral membrane protein
MRTTNQHEERAYLGELPLAIDAADAARGAFLRRTYAHLAGGVAVVVGIVFYMFRSGLVDELFVPFLVEQPYGWLGFFGGYMLASWIAHKMAFSGASPALQYFALGLYATAAAVFLSPILWFAQNYYPEANLIRTAGLITGLTFGGLTGFVLVSGKDFTFLRGVLGVLSSAAVGLMICSWIFGFTLGVVFVVAMIALMCCTIVYQTSAIQKQFPVNMHVAAALVLLSSVVTLFYYVIHLLMILQGRD